MIESIAAFFVGIATVISGLFGGGVVDDGQGAPLRVTQTFQGGTATSSVPEAGDILLADANKRYAPASLIAGSNVTIATTTADTGVSSITISSSGGGGSGDHSYPFPNTTAWGANATNTLTVFTGGIVSNASSTISATLTLDSLDLNDTATTTFAAGLRLDTLGLTIDTLTTCDVKTDSTGHFYCGADLGLGGGGRAGLAAGLVERRLGLAG